MKKSIILYALLYATSLGSYAQIASITKFTPCVCEQAETKRDLSKGFLPSCNQLKDITKWNAWGKEINCDKIFYANLKTNISAKNDAAFYGFSIIAFQPLRITIPDFTINLTPCNVSTPELGVRIMKQHKIKQYKASFDYENFDRTAKSYLDILMLISGVAEKDFLTVFLSNHFVGKNNITEFIHSINDRYNIAIPTNIPGKFPYNSWETNAITIVDTLYNNNVSLKEFILNEFVLAEDDANGTSHILTPDEGENLENLFVKWLGYFSINDIDNQIYPQMKVNFGTNVIGIEISTDIIQRWDKENKQSEPQQAAILAYLKNLEAIYSNSDEFNQTEIQSICPSTYKISGTDILFSFSNAQFNSFEKDDYWNAEVKSGLAIDDATFQIPFKKGWIMAKGKNMVLNNRCFTGNFEFQTDNTSSGKYIITSTEKGKAIKIPIKTLTESFESLSDEDMLFYFQESDEVLTIGFSKSKRL